MVYEELAKALCYNKKGGSLRMWFGRVSSVNSADATVSIMSKRSDGTDAGLTAAKCCECIAGDTVLILTQGGSSAAIARRG